MGRSEALRLLNLNSNFDENSLKEAYKKQIRKVHPDLNPNLHNAKELTQKINEAYELLKNELGKGSTSKSNGYKNTNTNPYNSYSSESYYEVNAYKIKILNLLETYKVCNNLNAKYLNDECYRIYQKYINQESIYNLTTQNTILRFCITKEQIDSMFNSYKSEYDSMINKFIVEIFTQFYQTYIPYISGNDRIRIYSGCIFYAENCDFEAKKSVNTCMEYYVKCKRKIVSQVIETNLNILISNCSEENKLNLKEDSKIQLVNKILNDHKLKEILQNLSIIETKFNKYLLECKEIYKKTKKEKIKELKTLLKQNKVKVYKKRLKDLKLEKNASEFDHKYAILKTEVDELLTYKHLAIKKATVDKCLKNLTDQYNKCKDKKIHEDNYKKVLYYLSMVENEELPLDVIEILNDIKFKYMTVDYVVLNRIEIEFILNKELYRNIR